MNAFQEALSKLRSGTVWIQEQLSDSYPDPLTGKVVYSACLVGLVWGDYEAVGEHVVEAECLSEVLCEQYPDFAKDAGDSSYYDSRATFIAGVNDNAMHSQDEAERVLEKASIRLDERVTP